MKRLNHLCAVMALLLLSGCFEINEQIDIKPGGNGSLSVKTDMSQLIELMQNYLGKEDIDEQLPKGALDTIVYMKNIPDSVSNMSAENRALVKDGTVHIKLNVDEKVFKTDLFVPFENQGNLQKLYNSMNNQSMGMAGLFKNMAGQKDSMGDQQQNMPDMSQFNSVYDFQSHDGLLSRKLNAEKWKNLQESAQFSQMKEAAGMGIEVPYTLTVNLPRPVKKVDNSLAVISADKKQIVIKYNLVEVFQHPEQFEYTIVY
jgi:hypothetical protein